MGLNAFRHEQTNIIHAIYVVIIWRYIITELILCLSLKLMFILYKFPEISK